MRVIHNREMIEFSGGLAHELANIFTAAAGNLSLLDDGCCKGSGECLLALGDIRHATVRGFDLTAALKAYAGRQTLRPIRLEINQAITDLMDASRPNLPPQIEVKFFPAPQNCTVIADGTKLAEALTALFVNACEAMPKGGKLTIVVAVEPDASGTPHVRIAVRDTGVGMTAEFAARAFEPMVTTKGHAFRNGWGLAICAGFVRQSNGFMDIESKPGGGTTVAIMLPLA